MSKLVLLFFLIPGVACGTFGLGNLDSASEEGKSQLLDYNRERIVTRFELSNELFFNVQVRWAADP